MFFEVSERVFAKHRVHPYKCIVKDDLGRVLYKKNFEDYNDAWQWGYNKVRMSRR